MKNIFLVLLTATLCLTTFSIFGTEVKTSETAQQTAVSAASANANTSAQTAATAAPEIKKENKKSCFSGTFWALVPPLLAIILALITKEVFSSLFIGIFFGSCLISDFSPFKTMDIMINEGLIGAVKGTAGIFIFLVMLGIIVALINETGAAASFGIWARRNIKSRRGAGFISFFFGILIFIDDYFNCLTVGSVMRPVTDAKRISRAKLSYIIDATAAPVCMIAPISSWAAAVSQYAEGSKYSGLELFIRAIPYNFYSLLTLIFVAVMLALNLDFGPMVKYENSAAKGSDLSIADGANDSEAKIFTENFKGRVFDIIIPVVILILFAVFALVYVGGIFEGKSFAAAFSDTDASVGLPWGALPVLIITIIYFLCRRIITFQNAMSCISKGFSAMVPAILILTFATALKNMTNMLEGREFIAGVIGNAAPSLAQFLPAVIFVVASFLAFSTGTSWGTFGILIPIVVSIFPAGSPLLYIGMSACLAGAVCGDHCSPISDTTVMSSAGAGCDHIIHISTQLPYAITVAVFSFAGFLLAGIVNNWFIVFPLVTLLMIGSIFILKFFIFKNR